MSRDSRAIRPEANHDAGDGAPVNLQVGGGEPRETGPGVPDVLPLLPLRNAVVFPGTVMPLGVNREKSKRLLDAVLASESKMLAVVGQKGPEIEDPTFDDLYRMGTACAVMKLLRMRDGSQNAIIHGIVRVRVLELAQSEPYLAARVQVVRPEAARDNQMAAMLHTIRQAAARMIELSPNAPDEAAAILGSIDEPNALADFVAANLAETIEDRQDLLETVDAMERLGKVHKRLLKQIDVLELSRKIQDQARGQIDKAQRQYFLQEQLKAIQRELGEMEGRQAEAQELRERITAAGMPEDVQTEAMRQVDRMERIPQASPEYSVARDHLEWLISLPWSTSTQDVIDIERAAEILDRDHYDLERVKKRILEFLAVRKLRPAGRGPILCLIGPPGVGKTSLGQSIARAMGRKFIRMSLGGARDEADIRGHRRTYIGALPGRIIQEIRTAGTNNPVFMLDEMDKIGADFRGDPASALLEVLDPEQNRRFVDHYLGVPFDLSKVLFIGTANWTDPIPAPLRDRMEMIDIPGYTLLEKRKIARRYLIPRQVAENGLTDRNLELTDEALDDIIDNYTREAGVRSLEREIAAVCRAVAAEVGRGRTKKRVVTRRNLRKFLGPERFVPETALRAGVPGVATALAYTPTGGEIIFVEATAMPGRGNLTLTGQIGNVMRESAQAAFSIIRSRRKELLGSKDVDLSRMDVHIHVPAGAVPKDGPSAGVAMLAALMSLLSNEPVRADAAMTGEITLRGIVLPIGGVKEKVLAAHRAGIRTLILPRQNKKDLPEVHKEVRDEMKFVFVERVEEALKAALSDFRPPIASRNRSRAAAPAKSRERGAPRRRGPRARKSLTR